MAEIWYRANGHRYSGGCDEWGNSIGGGPVGISFYEFKLVKTTAKGVWLIDTYSMDKPRFVLLSARKRFAHPSEREALESFIARKKRQVKILSAQILDAKRLQAHAEGMLEAYAT